MRRRREQFEKEEEERLAFQKIVFQEHELISSRSAATSLRARKESLLISRTIRDN